MSNRQLYMASHRLDIPDLPITLEELQNQVGGHGWDDIIARLVSDLFDMGWDGKISQIKEKFGGLRLYPAGGTWAIEDRIIVAERESEETCQDCGDKGKIHPPWYWMITHCDACNEKRVKASATPTH